MNHALALLSETEHKDAAARQRSPRDPLPIDAYANKRKSIAAQLAGGGDLLLVRVTWNGMPFLVARLESPKLIDRVWRSARPNPLVTRHDSSAKLQSLRLADGSMLPTDPTELKRCLRGGVAIDEAGVRHLDAELSDTKRSRPPRLSFENRRAPTSASVLTPAEKRQIQRAGELYDGRKASVAERLTREDDADSPYLHDLTGYDVRAADEVRYDAWFYRGDSGCIFRHRTDEVVAEVVQFGLECDDDVLYEAILDAVRRARKEGSGITLDGSSRARPWPGPDATPRLDPPQQRRG